MSMKLAVEKKVTFHLILFAFKYVYQLRECYIMQLSTTKTKNNCLFKTAPQCVTKSKNYSAFKHKGAKIWPVFETLNRVRPCVETRCKDRSKF